MNADADGVSAVGGEGTRPNEKRIEAAADALLLGWGGLLTTKAQREAVARSALAAADAVSGEGSDLARAAALDAIAYVRKHYDESIFPPRPKGRFSEVYDGEAASVARLTCDNILREFNERLGAAWDTQEQNRD